MNGSCDQMNIDEKLWFWYEKMVPYVNVYICQLLGIAESRGMCKYDSYGDLFLEKIPEKELCTSIIAAINKGWLIEFAKDIKSYFPGNCDIDNIRDAMKDILIWCFGTKDDTSSTGEKKYIKIVGHTAKDKNIRMSFFHALSFYKWVYEADGINAPEKFYLEHIEIPYETKCQIFEEKMGRNKQLYVMEDREKWYKDMKKFMNMEGKEEGWYGYLDDIELDRIKREMLYLTKV